MKDETAGVGIEEFFRLKPEMYSYLVDDNSEHKKAKSINKNVAAKGIMNIKMFCWIRMRHSLNRIQSKDHRIRTYEIHKISFYCLDHEIYIQNNRYDGLAVGY